MIKTNEAIAIELRNVLLKHGVQQDTRIYFNNKAYTYDRKSNGYELVRGVSPVDYFDGASDYTVCVTFEGPLYDSMNHDGDVNVVHEINAILNMHGAYYEMYNSWNLVVHYK